MRKMDANVFYCEQARSDFLDLGLSFEKTFVANNTFKVEITVPAYKHDHKDLILFVGSLDGRKRNIELLEAFSIIIHKIPNGVSLAFVGDGPELAMLQDKADHLGLAKRVNFLGRKNSTNELKPLYNRALCSISYGQAGLSVLQSMGFGVPFVTLKDAISGGEITNIRHRHNGILLDPSPEHLCQMLIEICNNENYARSLGFNAYQHYQEHCKLEHMVKGFVEAIQSKI